MIGAKSNNSGFGLVGWLLIVAAAVLIGLGGWFVTQQNKEDAEPTDRSPSGQAGTFANPKKGAHFESSTPAHASSLAAVPVDVVIDFNFDLADNSTIKIIRNGQDYGTGNTIIDSNKLAMRRQMDQSAPDGVYTVKYNGCWPDRTCHDGHFQFAIDSQLLNSYDDLRGQSSITIKMSNIKFQPMNIIVSSGTNVTWVNDDAEEHYVNTDSHPAHTHVPSLNSQSLAQGQSYSFTFTATGAYPYHCSAHAADMAGNIVVL